MSVTIRPYRTGGWEVDIHVILPNGTRARSRTRKRTSKSAALRWGLSRERAWLMDGLPHPRKEVPALEKEVPTLEDFAERFVDGSARANREKPSSIAAKEMSPACPPCASTGRATTGCHQERRCAATEAGTRIEGRQNGQQCPHGAQRAPEDRGGMAGHQPDALHDPIAARTEVIISHLPRLW